MFEFQFINQSFISFYTKLIGFHSSFLAFSRWLSSSSATLFSTNQFKVWINLCIFMIPRMMGNFWNKLLFDVTRESLDDLWKLYIFEGFTILICMCYLPLIPTWAEVEEVQQ